MYGETYQEEEIETELIGEVEVAISHLRAEGLLQEIEDDHQMRICNYLRGDKIDRIRDAQGFLHSPKFVNSNREKRIEKMRGEDVLVIDSSNLLRKNVAERKKNTEDQKRNGYTENEMS